MNKITGMAIAATALALTGCGGIDMDMDMDSDGGEALQAAGWRSLASAEWTLEAGD